MGDGSRFRIAQLGMPRYQRETKDKDAGARSSASGGGKDKEEKLERGDLVVETKVVWPEKLEAWRRDLVTRAFADMPGTAGQ
jgi:DnaJ-class molecular chaperone